MIFRQIAHDDLGCASYLVGDEDAGLAGPRFAVTSGGLACITGVAVVVAAFPALARFDAEEILAARVGSAP